MNLSARKTGKKAVKKEIEATIAQKKSFLRMHSKRSHRRTENLKNHKKHENTEKTISGGKSNGRYQRFKKLGF